MSTNLKVIIPAAGGGTRLKPHTNTTPKVMLHVAGKPIIGHIIDLVTKVSPEEIVVVVGAQGERIEEYLRSTYPLKFRFVVQAEPKGLGHAVAQARDCVQDNPVLVLLGDTIVDMDLTRMVGAENKLAVRVVENPRRFGVVELKDGFVSHVVEKPIQPKSNLAIVGVYYFEKCLPLFSALDELIQRDKRTRGEYQLTDALQIMVQNGVKIRPWTIEHWLDCGTPEALLETNRYLLRNLHHSTERPGVVIVPPVYIEDTAVIEHSVIGPNASIGASAQIRDSVIRNSIVNQGAEVVSAILDNSILGCAAKYEGRALHLNLGDSSEMKSG
jgi:glucose-1-phosphate thymidylyltransferase